MIEVIKMNTVIVSIEKGKEFYSAYVSDGLNDHAINGQGKTKEDAIQDFKEAFKEIKEMYEEEGQDIPQELLNVELEYRHD